MAELRRRGVVQGMSAYAVAAWVIIQVVSELGDNLGIPEWIGALVTIVLIVAAPAVFYIAWFFDIHNGRLVRTPPAGNTEQLQPLGVWHWLGLLVTLAGVTSVGMYSFEQVSTRLQKEQDGIAALELGQRIAVLPFRDSSAERDQQYLAEGIAEEIAYTLGRTPALRVSSVRASFQLAREGKDPQAIARTLEVDTLLDGDVRVAGDRLKVRVDLIDASDGSVLWNESFSRKLADVFEIEEEISRSVVNLLQDQYFEVGTVNAQARTGSMDAYVLYLQGRAALRERTTESVKAGRKLFEQAVGLDPEYAAAYAGVAQTLWMLARGRESWGDLDPATAATLAEKNVEKALLREPQLAEAYASLGRVFALRGDPDGALAAYDKALAINPSLAEVHVWRYLTLKSLQRYDDAMTALRAAQELDPESPLVLYNMGVEHSAVGEADEAYEYFEKLMQQDADNPLGYRGMADAAFRNKELARAARYWREAMALTPDGSQYRDEYIGLMLSMGLADPVRDIATDPFWDANLLLADQEYEALFEKMAFDVAASPDDPWIAFEAGWYEALLGDEERGAQLMRQAAQYFAPEELYAMPMCSPAVELAWAARHAGDETTANTHLERCQALADAALADAAVEAADDHLAARLAALRGDGEAAQRHLQTAIDNGWLEWWTRRDPLTRSLQGDAAAEALYTRIETELAEQARLTLEQLDAP